MVILLVGGGSGGHITPLLAVAHKLKQQNPNVTITYIGERGGGLADIVKDSHAFDDSYQIFAGKLRRYHDEGIRQLLDIPTLCKNLRDLGYMLIGFFQSWYLLGRIKPDVIFLKGGFVCVPVGLAAALRRIPYITHDSDSTQGLSNRITARWAVAHAVALPKELYPYRASKTFQTGVPINQNYQLVTPKQKLQYKKELHIASDAHVLLVTGGGNGAQQLNQLTVSSAQYLLKLYQGLIILHITGRAHQQAVLAKYDHILSGKDRNRVMVRGFITDLYRYSGAADVVVARGGATNLMEFAAQGKPCIIVPSKQLVWNIKNTDALAKVGAVIKLTETEAEKDNQFGQTVAGLLGNEPKQAELANALHELASPDAALQISQLLLKYTRAGKG